MTAGLWIAFGILLLESFNCLVGATSGAKRDGLRVALLLVSALCVVGAEAVFRIIP